MGGIFSRIWLLPRRKKSSKESLEGLESELQILTNTRKGSQKCERTVIFVLLVILLLVYPVILLVGICFWIWLPDFLSNEYIAVYLLVVVAIPILLYGVKRISNSWFAHRKTQYNSAIESVHEEKKRVLEEVMEKEPYKVARELLEKYDPKNPQLLPRQAPITDTQQTVRQRRPVVPQSPHPSIRPIPSTPRVIMNTPRQPPFVQQPFTTPSRNTNRQSVTITPLVAASQYPNATSMESSQQIPPGHCFGVAPGPPAPVPILPRDRTGLDKVMDFMLGDGPTNRYALVCSECHSHNGMALKDEFEYLSFRCAYCYFLNEAKKSKPKSIRPPPLITSSQVVLPNNDSTPNNNDSTPNNNDSTPTDADETKSSVEQDKNNNNT